MAKKIIEFSQAKFLTAALKSAETAIGKAGVYSAAEHDARQFGFHIPTFALRYLISHSVWPLQRVTSCAGPPKGHKSSFAYQLQRWVLDAGGMVTHVETENKAAIDIQKSIVGPRYMDPASPDSVRMTYINPRTLNEWIKVLNDQMTELEELCGVVKSDKVDKKDVMAKPLFPIMWNIDTLVGKGTEEDLGRVTETGESMGRGFGDAPLLINQFFQNTRMLGWPLFLHITHQDKDDPKSGGKRNAGGVSPEFFSSIFIRFSSGQTSSYGQSTKIDSRGVKGMNVRMKVHRSSIGPGDREIVVPFVWRMREEPVEGQKPKIVQDFMWDWNSATAELLLNQPPSSPVRDIMEVKGEMTKGVGKVYWCKELGITAADPLKGDEFGAAFEANTELVAQVEALLAIKQGNPITYEAMGGT